MNSSLLGIRGWGLFFVLSVYDFKIGKTVQIEIKLLFKIILSCEF